MAKGSLEASMLIIAKTKEKTTLLITEHYEFTIKILKVHKSAWCKKLKI